MSSLDLPRYQELYKGLLYVRTVEEWISDNYVKRGIRCPVHLSLGQEAAAVGVIGAINSEDLVFSTHRCHAHYLAKGGSIKKMIGELMGFSSGCCGGRGGSMHLHDYAAGLISSIPIVGSVIPLAVGYAQSLKLRHRENVVVVFFGDGAFEEGVVHECLNYCSLRGLKVVFVCENNLFSCFTELSQRQPNRSLSDVASSHGVQSWTIENGNDVHQVYKTSREVLDYVNRNFRPAFLEVKTFRLVEHCGVNSDDHLGYRDPALLKHWRHHDCIEIMEKILNNEVDQERLLSEIKSPFIRDVRALLDDTADQLAADVSSYQFSQPVAYRQES